MRLKMGRGSGGGGGIGIEAPSKRGGFLADFCFLGDVSDETLNLETVKCLKKVLFRSAFVCAKLRVFRVCLCVQFRVCRVCLCVQKGCPGRSRTLQDLS